MSQPIQRVGMVTPSQLSTANSSPNVTQNPPSTIVKPVTDSSSVPSSTANPAARVMVRPVTTQPNPSTPTSPNPSSSTSQAQPRPTPRFRPFHVELSHLKKTLETLLFTIGAILHQLSTQLYHGVHTLAPVQVPDSLLAELMGVLEEFEQGIDGMLNKMGAIEDALVEHQGYIKKVEISKKEGWDTEEILNVRRALGLTAPETSDPATSQSGTANVHMV